MLFKKVGKGKFCSKSPATTIETLAKCLKKKYNSKSKVKVIGIRHGEKNHETLISSEEMPRAKSEKNYFKLFLICGILNYSKYFIQGNKNFQNLQNTIQIIPKG